MRVLHDGPIFLSYAQFSIVQRGVTEPTIKDAFAGSGNGLCGGAVPGALHFITATKTGRVIVRVEEYAEQPRLPASAWADVVETRFTITSREHDAALRPGTGHALDRLAVEKQVADRIPGLAAGVSRRGHLVWFVGGQTCARRSVGAPPPAVTAYGRHGPRGAGTTVRVEALRSAARVGR